MIETHKSENFIKAEEPKKKSENKFLNETFKILINSLIDLYFKSKWLFNDFSF